MKQSFRLASASVSTAMTLVFILSATLFAQAQTPSATPDSLVAQITNAPASTGGATVNGISGNGRFVVFESNANLAPADPARPTTVEPNNADGNREIFLFDYAQRRTFQITNTKSALNDPTKPPVDPATPTNFSNILVEVSNNRPIISYDGRWIVFSSNAYVDGNSAASPKNFNGSESDAVKAALRADGNQEIFLYRVPNVTDVDLSSGAEVALIDLSIGTLTRITFTTNTIKPRAGTANSVPTVVDDNRFATLNDDGSTIAFVSSRNLATANGGANADLNPEIYLYNRNTGAISQVTSTANPANSTINLVWNANPSLSGDGTIVSFISSADIVGPAEADGARGNGEIYFARFNGSAVSDITRVTRTPVDSRGSSIVLSPGARMSRNGNLIVFESTADIQSNGTIQNASSIYLYNIGASAFTQVTRRPADDVPEISLRFPTFTGDSSTIVFASRINFASDGQISASTTEGLNPRRRTQIFAVPAATPTTFTRLTNTPTDTISLIQMFPASTTRRIAFSYSGAELGGGNADFSTEGFYLLLPNVTGETPAPSPSPAPSPGPVAYFSGASVRPVVSASPTPTPAPESVSGLAPGMLAIARSTTVSLAPSNREVGRTDAQEDRRRPPLPIELNGVSVSIGGSVAAGLYFVSPGQINFVVPLGLPAGTYAVSIYNGSGLAIRSSLQVNAAQPDIFTSTNGPSGRAAVFNATNPCVTMMAEPFSVTSVRPTGGNCSSTETETVPAELLIMLTGVRGVQRTAVTVRIGTTDLTGDAIVSVGPSLTAGFDQIVVRLPATLAAAGDVPIIVTVSGASSRPSDPDTAPRIRIN